MAAPAKTGPETQHKEAPSQPAKPAPTEAVIAPASPHLRTQAYAQVAASAGQPPQAVKLPQPQRSVTARRVGQLSANHLLQQLLRRDADGSHIIRRVPVNLGGTTAAKGGEAASAIGLLVIMLRQELPGVPESEAAYVAAQNVITEGDIQARNLGGQADQEIDETVAGQLNGWYADYVSASDGLNSYQKRIAAEQIQAAEAKAAELQGQTEAARGQFDFPLEQAFRQNDNERLVKLRNGMNALQTAKTSVDALQSALTIVYGKVITPGIKAAALVYDVKEAFDKFYKVAAAYSAAKAVVSLISGGEGVTQSAKEISNISTALSATGSAATLIGVAGGYMIGINAIIPVAVACFGVVSNILGREGRQLNQLALQEMKLDDVAWEYVPGGRSCFEFMVAVMQAGDSSAVPLPLHPQVNAFFVDTREQMESGTGNELPTSGYWFWREVDQGKIQRWAFNNRRNIWSMLYGELRPVGVPF